MRHLAMEVRLAGDGGLQWVRSGLSVGFVWAPIGLPTPPPGAYGASQAVAGCQICPCPTKAVSGLVMMLGGGPLWPLPCFFAHRHAPTGRGFPFSYGWRCQVGDSAERNRWRAPTDNPQTRPLQK